MAAGLSRRSSLRSSSEPSIPSPLVPDSWCYLKHQNCNWFKAKFSDFSDRNAEHIQETFPAVVINGKEFHVESMGETSTELPLPSLDAALRDLKLGLSKCLDVSGVLLPITVTEMGNQLLRASSASDLPPASPSESEQGEEERDEEEAGEGEPGRGGGEAGGGEAGGGEAGGGEAGGGTGGEAPPRAKRQCRHCFTAVQAGVLASRLDHLRVLHDLVERFGCTNDRGKEHVRSLFELATYDLGSVMCVISTANHMNQVLALHTKAYTCRLDGGRKVMQVNGIPDVALLDKANGYMRMIGEIKPETDIAKGKAGYGQLVIAMLTAFVVQEGRHPVWGVSLSPKTYTTFEVKRVGNVVQVITHGFHQRSTRIGSMIPLLTPICTVPVGR